MHPNISVKDLANKLRRKQKAILNLLQEYGYKIDNGVDTGILKNYGLVISLFFYRYHNTLIKCFGHLLNFLIFYLRGRLLKKKI